jgi:hypothetical protein
MERPAVAGRRSAASGVWLESGGDGGAGGGEDGGHFCFGEGEEGLDDHRIKLSATGLVKPTHSLFKRQALAVGAGRNHGVEGIDDADDARNDGDFGPFQSRGVSLSVERLVVMENIESRTLESREHAQYGPAVLRVLLHEGIFLRIKTSGLAKDGIRDAHFADVVEKRRNLKILKLGFFQAQFLPNAHTPFRQPGAVDTGVEIFQVEELVEGADDGIAEGSRLFFELLDAKRLQRPERRGTLHGRWNLVIRHCSYKQNKKQEPEPDVEPELFTQAETA